MKKFLQTYADILFFIPATVFLLVTSYWIIPSIDPRAGVFDLGPLQVLFFNASTTLGVFFLSWVAIRVYSTELSVEEEKNLLNKLTPLQQLIWEATKWILSVGLVSYLLLRHL